MVRGWRLTPERFAHSAFTGEGARRYGGRWNKIGSPLVYAAGSLALAALEVLVHLQPEYRMKRYVAMPFEISEENIEDVPPDSLPATWRKLEIHPSTVGWGERWLREERSLALRAPSVIVPQERNILINPLHPRFSQVKIGESEPFAFDPRLA